MWSGECCRDQERSLGAQKQTKSHPLMTSQKQRAGAYLSRGVWAFLIHEPRRGGRSAGRGLPAAVQHESRGLCLAAWTCSSGVGVRVWESHRAQGQ